MIRLPNDRTANPRPSDGYPYRASFVADNDLALGWLVTFLSKTAIWKDSTLFVTEDDAQGGVDHIDAHRSILLVTSPWVKPGAVSRQHTSIGSITSTIDEVLGLSPMNLEEALAGKITGIFSERPHMELFVPRPADPRSSCLPARFAKPKTKEKTAALRDIDDACEIRKKLRNPRTSRIGAKTMIDFLVL